MLPILTLKIPRARTAQDTHATAGHTMTTDKALDAVMEANKCVENFALNDQWISSLRPASAIRL